MAVKSGSAVHCVKCVQIRSFSWSVFSLIRTDYGKIRSISPYSVRMRENTDQKVFSPNAGKCAPKKNSVFGHFLRSGPPELSIDGFYVFSAQNLVLVSRSSDVVAQTFDIINTQNLVTEAVT